MSRSYPVVPDNLVSNALGTINPVEKHAARAHEQGAIMVVDAAQAVPHRRIDVRVLGRVFVVAKTTWNDLSHTFEAGTPPIGEAVGMSAAIDYLTEIAMEAIEEHDHALAAYALERLADVPGVHAFGPPAEWRAGMISFDVASIPTTSRRSSTGRASRSRAGHHWCQPLRGRLGVAAREPGERLPLHELDAQHLIAVDEGSGCADSDVSGIATVSLFHEAFARIGLSAVPR